MRSRRANVITAVVCALLGGALVFLAIGGIDVVGKTEGRPIYCGIASTGLRIPIGDDPGPSWSNPCEEPLHLWHHRMRTGSIGGATVGLTATLVTLALLRARNELTGPDPRRSDHTECARGRRT